jgi:hypothetical protein
MRPPHPCRHDEASPIDGLATLLGNQRGKLSYPDPTPNFFIFSNFENIRSVYFSIRHILTIPLQFPIFSLCLSWLFYPRHNEGPLNVPKVPEPLHLERYQLHVIHRLFLRF